MRLWDDRQDGDVRVPIEMRVRVLNPGHAQVETRRLRERHDDLLLHLATKAQAGELTLTDGPAVTDTADYSGRGEVLCARPPGIDLIVIDGAWYVDLVAVYMVRGMERVDG